MLIWFLQNEKRCSNLNTNASNYFHPCFNDKGDLGWIMNFLSHSWFKLKIAPSRRNATRIRSPFGKGSNIIPYTHMQFFGWLHMSIIQQHFFPIPLSSHSTGPHQAALATFLAGMWRLIFRHTSPAVCWLFRRCCGEGEQVSSEQGARLASSPASPRLLMCSSQRSHQVKAVISTH